MDSNTLKTKASQHCDSFAKAIGLGRTDKATPTTIAQAMFNHWHPQKFMVFLPEGRLEFADREVSVPKLTQILDKFVEHNLGLDIRMDNIRVETVSPSSALCFMTVSVHPSSESGIEVFDWENVYLFRISPGQEDGYFDLGILDNEFAALTQKAPTFFEGAES